jgi:hypothetical protein
MGSSGRFSLASLSAFKTKNYLDIATELNIYFKN